MFLKKITKIDQRQLNCPRKKEKKHTTKIRNKKGDITVCAAETREIIRDYYDYLYIYKSGNFRVDKSLQRHLSSKSDLRMVSKPNTYF